MSYLCIGKKCVLLYIVIPVETILSRCSPVGEDFVLGRTGRASLRYR